MLSVCACVSDHQKAGNLLKGCTLRGHGVWSVQSLHSAPLQSGSQVSSLFSTLLSTAIINPTEEIWIIQL